MKFKFKIQPFQTAAVNSVIDCFAGQTNTSSIKYRVDPGKDRFDLDLLGFKNSNVQLTPIQLLANIQAVQKRQNLPISEKLVSSNKCPINLDIEMETGTGKTYCYIKTIFEMNRCYGWCKFIIVVPNIAIREGVHKSFEITAEHFTETYNKKARFFLYNSKQLHDIEHFSSDANINVMIINIQAFNASGKDNRRIYDELDDFQSRRPIDVISSNHPILILDEPQKMEGAKTLDALDKFKPLMILRYSATHRNLHNKIHRLDALDAYNQKLVKKIAARGISVKGLAGTSSYLYLQSIEISKKDPVAFIEIEIKQKSGAIQRRVVRLEKGQDLFTASGELGQYRGFVISEIEARSNTVEFTNGHLLSVGEACGDVNELTLRRIQIRETIKAHIEKEWQLFSKGIKVLSLFFIDEVAKYRDYSQEDEKGVYARIFEEEYEQIKNNFLAELPLRTQSFHDYLKGIDASRTHNGYFSIDKKTKRFKDPETAKQSFESDDVAAYDLILKDKARLLSFDEQVRFIFSHSALREGWDNPNIFVLCMLKHSDNTISRRQEVGRGLRLAVNRNGERMDNPETVHDINVLTVVANESFKDFANALQKEMSASLASRSRKADPEYFTGKIINIPEGEIEITANQAKQIYKYLNKNGYSGDVDEITAKYHADRTQGTLASLPSELALFSEQVFILIDSVFSDAYLPEICDGRKVKTNPLNANFYKKEFQELWNRINSKAIYQVDFDSAELVHHCIRILDDSLKVTPLQYSIQEGIQNAHVSDSELISGKSFTIKRSAIETHEASIQSAIKYDLIGKIAENTQLTRKTIAEILGNIRQDRFDQFKRNPEYFITEASRIINEQKATIIIERLSYHEIADKYENNIFTIGQCTQDFSKATEKLKNHIYDYVIPDSALERTFVKDLDTSNEVVVYAKLPKGFQIPTPVGNYSPDWAISFKEGTVKHIFFVAETKGAMSSMQFRGIEDKKIDCARKFFDAINRNNSMDNVKYDVVNSFDKLMELIGQPHPHH